MKATRAWGPAGAAAALFVCAVLGVAGCAAREGPADRYPGLAAYEGREIERVIFVDPAPYTADTLAQVVETEPSHCRLLGLPICIPFTDIGREERRLDAGTVLRDVRRLALFYRQSGYFGTEVVPAVEPVRPEDGVEVRFVILRGDPVTLESFRVEGVDTVLDAEQLRELRARLPLREGELFDVGDFAASADTVQSTLLELGRAYAQVLRNYAVDTVVDVARATLRAVPGPRVVVDTIVVRGAEQLGRRAVVRQLTFRAGELLRADELVESQRNLYGLELVQFATVSIAPDSLQLTPSDSATATVVVRIVEGPVHVVEAAVGYGTVDCFRTRVEWVSRSFGGGARRLALTGSLSKIGIGRPLDAGFGGSICRAFEGDPFADELDYRFSADLTQPWFLSPRNQLALSAYAERQSEPNVFQREAQGARLAVARRLGMRSALTVALDVERASTIALPALFCTAFLVCLPSDIAALSRPRWKNSLGLDWVRDRSVPVVDPVDGYVVRGAVAWAAPWLASEVDFTRGTVEGTRYLSFGRGWSLAGHLELGSFFGTASLNPGEDFLPPEERFYAGGANSVRGFGRNELGPGVYVGDNAVFDSATIRFVPIGGTTLGVANLELRTPVPVLSEYLRLAFFVDAGAVGGEEVLRRFRDGAWRVTPGIGLRASTPIGPVRLDVAYNPYDPLVAPLYLPDPETEALIRVLDEFQPPPESFLGRFRVHLAVGGPF
ncbi:MAG TPA: BamA/TamA family outer membrane protein [Longimicrobiales bacterium]